MVDSIMIHCSATKEGVDFRASDIDRWHKQRGMRMIGYNYVIDLDGTVEKGRPEMAVGAHCNIGGYNYHAISICYVGGLDRNGKPKDTRTPAQKMSMLSLVRDIFSRYPTISDILGHRDVPGVRKDCPCFNVRAEFPIAICKN